MRIYLPATRSDLHAGELTATRAHAVTADLRRELPDDEEEILELVAFLAAANDSVALIAARNEAPRRVIIAADVPTGQVGPPPAGELETVVTLASPVPWQSVVAIHIDDDDPATAAHVHAAAQGDEEALDGLGEQELAWYDVTELDILRAQPN